MSRVYQDYYSSDSSESEPSDLSTESNRALSDYELEEECILEEGDQLHSLRQDILDSVFDSVQIYVSTAEYEAPPDDRLPPLKRARTTNWNLLQEDKSSSEASEDPNVVIIPRQRGYFHFSCPYYRRKPEKYQACLLGHDLQSIEDVIHHLQEDHTEPPYCPICRQPFERALVRDNHVRARVCQVSQGEVDGVNERQKRRLEKQDRIQLGETKRWARIWKTVFPSSDDVPQPYMSLGAEREISIIRDFWKVKGLSMVSEYMEKQDTPDQHEPVKIAALSKLVLQDILNRVLRDQPTKSETC
uniref:C2H2-type domain-containing protein n=1 Tax=Bionectria ochroleuca TaxID=29856 RepID=A0A8H7K1V3_BIOOC